MTNKEKPPLFGDRGGFGKFKYDFSIQELALLQGIGIPFGTSTQTTAREDCNIILILIL